MHEAIIFSHDSLWSRHAWRAPMAYLRHVRKFLNTRLLVWQLHRIQKEFDQGKGVVANSLADLLQK